MGTELNLQCLGRSSQKPERIQTSVNDVIYVSKIVSHFLAFFAPISYFKFLEFKEFNKTVIPFALVGYENVHFHLQSTTAVQI